MVVMTDQRVVLYSDENCKIGNINFLSAKENVYSAKNDDNNNNRFCFSIKMNVRNEIKAIFFGSSID